VIIRFLGTHNAESKDTKLVSFIIDDTIAVDTGSLTSCLSFTEQEKIKAILLSHGHYDHIREIPTFAFNNTQRTTKVFANQHTLEVLSSHLVDGLIYPNFTEKNSFLKMPALELCPLEFHQPQDIDGYQVVAMPVNHPIDSTGLKITDKEGKELFYTGDTGPGLSSLWQHIRPQAIIMDMTFPNRFANVAQESGHLCPQMLKEELLEFRRVKNYLPQIILVHLSPQLEGEIKEELIDVSKELNHPVHVAEEGEKFTI
jgi:ribonuclease BN (tRNA processing enzyme)